MHTPLSQKQRIIVSNSYLGNEIILFFSFSGKKELSFLYLAMAWQIAPEFMGTNKSVMPLTNYGINNTPCVYKNN